MRRKAKRSLVGFLSTLSVFSFAEKGGRKEGQRVLGGDRRQKRKETKERRENKNKKEEEEEEEVQGERETTQRERAWVRKGRCVIGQKKKQRL